MINFGSTLRQAREQKGLTTRQIADATHMMAQTVEDLENENFSRIAAPIYGRGFVKLYCEAVGLDPGPLIDEFMEIFNGNRQPTIRRREESAPVTREPAPDAPDSTPDGEDDGILPAASDSGSSSGDAATPPEGSLFDFVAPAPVSPPARFAAPAPIDDTPHGFRFPIPPVVGRLLALAGIAIVLVWLIVAGFRALYSALTAPTAAPADATASPMPGNSPAPASRTPMDIPPLYID
ncbi:MAG: helix-turn-helix domain-containing protein [Kiritimatiellia bacterium]